jgi:precorrin-2 dehydrogenase/sirohydrochlorin ferrochelatase
MLPVFLDMTNRLAVVVGGGPVGQRKAAALLLAGARVRLVCLEPRPADQASPALDWITGPYAPAHLDGAALVFAAGPPEVNARVVADARSHGVWVNAASDPEAGDCFLPSVVRRGDFVVAVGTGGAAPALARTVRRRLESEFDAAFGEWVGLLAEVRELARQRVADAGKRRELLERLCGWEWLERLRREGAEAVREALRAEVETAP